MGVALNLVLMIIYLKKEIDKERKILEKLQEADKPLVLTKEMEV